MTTPKKNSWKNWTISAVLAGGLAFAGSAGADDRHSHKNQDRHVRKGQTARHDIGHARNQVRRARHENRRLDQHGALIDLHLDGLALLASVNGEYRLAHALDRTGDRIQRRLDRKGDRRLRNARRDLHSHRNSRHYGHVDRRHSHKHNAKHHVRHDHRDAKRSVKNNRRHKSQRADRIDRKGDHSDWLSDRARDSNRYPRNR